jgi:hypothetical protein
MLATRGRVVSGRAQPRTHGSGAQPVDDAAACVSGTVAPAMKGMIRQERGRHMHSPDGARRGGHGAPDAGDEVPLAWCGGNPAGGLAPMSKAMRRHRRPDQIRALRSWSISAARGPKRNRDRNVGNAPRPWCATARWSRARSWRQLNPVAADAGSGAACGRGVVPAMNTQPRTAVPDVALTRAFRGGADARRWITCAPRSK